MEPTIGLEPYTPEWEKPVKAVLDEFLHITEATTSLAAGESDCAPEFGLLVLAHCGKPRIHSALGCHNGFAGDIELNRTVPNGRVEGSPQNKYGASEWVELGHDQTWIEVPNRLRHALLVTRLG